MFHGLVGGQRFSVNITNGGQKNVAHPTSIGIYRSPTAPSPKGEGWDEGSVNALFYSPHPSPLQQERELGA